MFYKQGEWLHELKETGFEIYDATLCLGSRVYSVENLNRWGKVLFEA